MLLYKNAPETPRFSGHTSISTSSPNGNVVFSAEYELELFSIFIPLPWNTEFEWNSKIGSQCKLLCSGMSYCTCVLYIFPDHKCTKQCKFLCQYVCQYACLEKRMVTCTYFKLKKKKKVSFPFFLQNHNVSSSFIL